MARNMVGRRRAVKPGRTWLPGRPGLRRQGNGLPAGTVRFRVGFGYRRGEWAGPGAGSEP